MLFEVEPKIVSDFMFFATMLAITFGFYCYRLESQRSQSENRKKQIDQYAGIFRENKQFMMSAGGAMFDFVNRVENHCYEYYKSKALGQMVNLVLSKTITPIMNVLRKYFTSAPASMSSASISPTSMSYFPKRETCELREGMPICFPKRETCNYPDTQFMPTCNYPDTLNPYMCPGAVRETYLERNPAAKPSSFGYCPMCPEDSPMVPLYADHSSEVYLADQIAPRDQPAAWRQGQSKPTCNFSPAESPLIDRRKSANVECVDSECANDQCAGISQQASPVTTRRRPVFAPRRNYRGNRPVRFARSTRSARSPRSPKACQSENSTVEDLLPGPCGGEVTEMDVPRGSNLFNMPVFKPTTDTGSSNNYKQLFSTITPMLSGLIQNYLTPKPTNPTTAGPVNISDYSSVFADAFDKIKTANSKPTIADPTNAANYSALFMDVFNKAMDKSSVQSKSYVDGVSPETDGIRVYENNCDESGSPCCTTSNDCYQNESANECVNECANECANKCTYQCVGPAITECNVSNQECFDTRNCDLQVGDVEVDCSNSESSDDCDYRYAKQCEQSPMTESNL